MVSKIFTSPNSWFRLILPSDWDEYELEHEEGTYGFFNSYADQWKGNLRITPIRISGNLENGKISRYIDEEVNGSRGAIRLKFGEFDCAFYKVVKENQNDPLLIYFWIMVKKDFLFVCSFTINKDEEVTKENELELKTVQEIIKSIEII